MTAITDYKSLISRVSNQFDKTHNMYGDFAAARTTAYNAGNAVPVMARQAWVTPVPGSLETGVTAYIPIEVGIIGSTGASYVAVCEMINMGNLNIGTNTFTDGAAAPTRTFLGTSRQQPVGLWVEVTTVLNATPGNMTITYIDQSGNTAEATASAALTASAAVGSGSMVSLNTTDSGILDITTAAQSGGTTPTGVVTFWGIIPLTGTTNGSAVSTATVVDMIASGNVVRLGTSAVIGVIGTPIVAQDTIGYIRMVGDS